MRVWVAGLWALVFLTGLIFAGCMHPIVRVEKQCWNGRKFGQQLCRCRDLETGEFADCR